MATPTAKDEQSLAVSSPSPPHTQAKKSMSDNKEKDATVSDVERQSPADDAAGGRTSQEQDEEVSVFKSLGFLDRYLAAWIFLAMLTGILLGNFVGGVGDALKKGKFAEVSVPIGMGFSSFGLVSRLVPLGLVLMRVMGMWADEMFACLYACVLT